jgi:hypothetical protein
MCLANREVPLVKLSPHVYPKVIVGFVIGFAFAGLGTMSARAAGDEFCRNFSYQALEQFVEAQNLGCQGLAYPVWSKDFDHHYNWCKTVPESEATRGGQQRLDILQKCRNDSRQGTGTVTGIIKAVDIDQIAGSARSHSCSTYAQAAVAQQAQNEALLCGLQGSAWNPVYDDHYNWCMGLGDLKPSQDGHRMRQSALDQCSAARGTAKSARPIQVLGPQTQTNLPQVPSTSPSLAIDPGAGGQIPSNVDLQNLAQRAVTPPSRSVMVDSLLADPATRAQILALPNLRGASPETLAQHTLGGTTASVMGAGSAASSGHVSGGMSSSSGPRLPTGFDWNAGIQFSPFSAPPNYFIGGKGERLGTVDVGGGLISNDTVGPMYQRKVVIFGGGEVAASLTIDLPNETATYTIAFGISAKNNAQVPSEYYKGEHAAIKAYAQVPFRIEPLALAPLSTTGGFVAMFTFPRDMQNTAEVGQARFTVVLNGVDGWVFGGITITKL